MAVSRFEIEQCDRRGKGGQSRTAENCKAGLIIEIVVHMAVLIETGSIQARCMFVD